MKMLLIAVATALSTCASAETNTTVSPQGFALQNGNSANALFSGLVPEFQQLFRASHLASDFNGPVAITDIRFRLNEGAFSSMDTVVPRVEIRLSTTAVAPENMSVSYTANRGVDERTVYLRSNVTLSSPGGQAINPFDVEFRLETPFVYDPSAGNLLLYIVNSGPGDGRVSSLDAQSFASFAGAPFASYGGGGFIAAPILSALDVAWLVDAAPLPGAAEVRRNLWPNA
jgi:hypothetical protein